MSWSLKSVKGSSKNITEQKMFIKRSHQIHKELFQMKIGIRDLENTQIQHILLTDIKSPPPSISTIWPRLKYLAGDSLNEKRNLSKYSLLHEITTAYYDQLTYSLKLSEGTKKTYIVMGCWNILAPVFHRSS